MGPDILRTINLVLAIGIVLWLVSRWVASPELYERGSLRKDILVMAMLWSLAAVVGTVEQLFDSGTYFRVGFVLAALLTTISILARPKQEWISHTEG